MKIPNNDKERKEIEANSFFFLSNRTEWIQSFCPHQFREESFESLQSDSGLDQTAVEVAKGWTDKIDSGFTGPLILYGSPGSGKTRIASTCWNAITPRVPDRTDIDIFRLCQTADNVAFVRGEELPEYMKKREREYYEAMPTLQHLQSSYFLVLDDLDKFPTGKWSEGLLNLIDARLWCNRLPTIITMNTSPAELITKYGDSGEPIADRLVRSGGTFVRVQKENPFAINQQP